MEKKLNILLLEDLPSDVELAEREIKSVLENYTLKVVETEKDYLDAIESFQPDLIISDYQMPVFDGLSALHIKKKISPFTPFIILTGSMNEDTAVECMKAGADDYVIKEHIKRLGPVVLNAIDKKKTEEEHYFAVQALHKSEESYRTLFNRVPVGLYRSTRDGRILDVNPALIEMMGFSDRESMLASKVEYGYMDPEDRRHWLNQIEQNGLVRDYEVQWRRADGETIWIKESAGIVKDEHGQVQFYEGAVEDITKRKLAENALSESEEKYRLIVENAHDGIEITQDDRLIFSNSRFAEMLGYTLDEIIDIPFSKIFTEQAGKALLERRRNREEGLEAPDFYETTFIKKDGTVIDVEVNYEIIEYRGRPATFAVIRDITERLEQEKEIRKLSTAVVQNPASIIITDVSGRIEYVNPMFLKISGYTDEEVVGKKPSILKSGYHSDSFYKKMWRTISSGGVWKGEFKNMSKDGTIFWEDATIGPILDSEGKITNYIGIKEDITEKKQLEEQLTQSQRLEAVGQLAGGVAHDFNNLLTIINGYSAILLDEFENNTRFHNDILQILNAGKRAASLTAQLLAFSRKQIIQPDVLNLNSLISDTEKMLHRLIGEDIKLETKLGADLHKIKADKGQLDQILINLAVNARDAMPQGGSLIIETSNFKILPEFRFGHLKAKPGDYVLLTVSDTGTGMDEEMQKYIFEPFYTTKEEGRGTGLGLSTVYGIVKQNKGYIWVYSEPGSGTAFKIYLPANKAEIKKTDKTHDDIESLSGHETVLVVEDERNVRLLTSKMLLKYGYKVLQAGNGEEALKIIQENDGAVDLVLTDVIMPKMSGSELADEIIKQNTGIKIIFISGYTDDAISRSGILTKEFVLIQKPFQAVSLLKKIRDVLDG